MLARRFGIQLVSTACLALCSSSGDAAPESPVLARIVETGKIRVGMSGDQAPLNVRSKSGQLIGLEVDLANLVADALDVEVEFVTKPFPELLPALNAGDVDIVMSGMAITAKRSLDAVFVGPYMLSGKSILTKSPELAEPRARATSTVPTSPWPRSGTRRARGLSRGSSPKPNSSLSRTMKPRSGW